MIKINKNKYFSYDNKPLLIAEISGNHNGNKQRFLKTIESAFISGADMVKIQTYEPSDITLNSKQRKFRINSGIWKGKYLWDLYKVAHTPYEWHFEAFKIAAKHKKILFSSPFSKRAVDFLESHNVQLYKIASFEITDVKLINYIAKKNKPIIISTGMTNYHEIKTAIKEINKFHNKIIILHCVSEYPTALKKTNLSRINELKKNFTKSLIGVSDHTNNIYSSIATIPMGVVAIEKHFNLDMKNTVDSSFSILPKQLKELRQCNDDIFSSLQKKENLSNKPLYMLRRSIFASMNIKKNEKININNIDTYRPLIGIPAEYYFKIMNKRVKKNIKKFESIYFKDLY